ncbi:MAG: lipoyl(octanoyl) transferase LipB [Terracidiphilus sp.]
MIQYLYLGRVDYAEGLRLQAEVVRLRFEGRVCNVLLLLEHSPVLTLGRNANRANILASSQMLAARGVTLHEIDRGGDVTYHGPGQLVGYPIFDLRNMRNPTTGVRLGPVDFVRLMEEALIRLCAEFGVTAERICGLTGVWCPPDSDFLDKSCGTKKAIDPPAGERKIGAIGIHVSRGITSHGFAFNVTTDLDGFRLINPCGITDRPVTSLEKEMALTGRAVADRALDLEPLAHRAARQFGHAFEEPLEAVGDLATLDPRLVELAGRIRDAQAEPAVGVPLKVPRQIEQLQQRPERPVRV